MLAVYVPGVAFDRFVVQVTNHTLSFSAPKPDDVHGFADLELAFREEVVGHNATWRSATWKHGTTKNAIFFTIPKVHPHSFDRLTRAKTTKADKKRMEIDWSRWTAVDESEEDDEPGEDEEEAEGRAELVVLRALLGRWSAIVLFVSSQSSFWRAISPDTHAHCTTPPHVSCCSVTRWSLGNRRTCCTCWPCWWTRRRRAAG